MEQKDLTNRTFEEEMEEIAEELADADAMGNGGEGPLDNEAEAEKEEEGAEE